MSFETGTLKKEYLNPQNFIRNVSCEFKLPKDKVILSSIQLCNLGLFGVNNGQTMEDTGVGSMIKKVSLLCKGQELSKTNEANLVFHMLKHTSNSNRQANFVEAYGGDMGCRGFLVNHLGADADEYRKFVDIDGFTSSNITNASELLTGKGRISLSDILPILKSIRVLDTNVLEDLSIRVEFDPNLNNYNRGTAFQANQNITRPKLVYTCLYDDKVIKQEKEMGGYNSKNGLMWNEYEVDSYVVPINTAGQASNGTLIQQNISVKLNGFQNKFVNRMAIVNTYLTPSGVGTVSTPQANNNGSSGNLNSIVYPLQNLQVVVNGSNLFNCAGLDKQASINREFVETWGDISTALGASDMNTPNNALYIRGNALESLKIRQSRGYMGFSILQNVRDLQINYSRSGCQDNTSPSGFHNEGIRAVCIGEVMKRLVISGDKPVVYYE